MDSVRFSPSWTVHRRGGISSAAKRHSTARAAGDFAASSLCLSGELGVPLFERIAGRTNA